MWLFEKYKSFLGFWLIFFKIFTSLHVLLIYLPVFVIFFLPINSELVSSIPSEFFPFWWSLFPSLYCITLFQPPPGISSSCFVDLASLLHFSLLPLPSEECLFMNFDPCLPHHHLNLFLTSVFYADKIKHPQLCFTALSGSTDSYYWDFNILPR